MTIHELDLLDNALDSLSEALSKFEEGDDGDHRPINLLCFTWRISLS